LNQGDILSVQTSCFLLCREVITSQTAPITVQTVPVTAGSNQSILAGNSVQLQGTTTASSYSWSPTTALSAPTSLQPIATPSTTTTYTLTAQENGCSAQASVTISVTQKLTIPTTLHRAQPLKTIVRLDVDFAYIRHIITQPEGL
jgi:hypothetical protein